MNVPPWHLPTPKPARGPLHCSARTCLERLEERITPTTANITASPFPITVNNPNAHANLSLERTAQPLASPVSPANDGSSVSGGTAAQAPTLFQAWQSLFIDGASLETQRLFYKFVENIDEFPLGSTLADSIAKAAASGINFNAVMALSQSLAGFKDQLPDALFADIEFNLQFAGPFGLAVGVAGASAANQAVQIQPMSSPSS
jgi:hypothetical protein